MRKKLVIGAVLFITILTAGYFFARPALSRLSDFLSKSERVEGNILIIEGWLSVNDLNSAIEEFHKSKYDHIVITGLKSTPKFYNVYTDGFLIFYPGDAIQDDHEDVPHTIEVKAFSELAGDNAAHFNLWINDSLTNGFFADKRKRKYGILWNGDLQTIDSVMVQFDNDIRGDFGDRNLFVSELIFDKKVRVSFLNHSIYDISGLDNKNRIINNMRSNADLTRNRLISMGIDSTSLISITGEKVRINRTLTSALAFRDWISKSGIEVTGINIISAGTHARRTWMTFDKVLDNTFRIGIISLPDHRHDRSEKMKILKTIRETIAYIYYSIILIPY
jgi:hypothetical protein